MAFSFSFGVALHFICVGFWPPWRWHLAQFGLCHFHFRPGPGHPDCICLWIDVGPQYMAGRIHQFVGHPMRRSGSNRPSLKYITYLLSNLHYFTPSAFGSAAARPIHLMPHCLRNPHPRPCLTNGARPLWCWEDLLFCGGHSASSKRILPTHPTNHGS